MRSYAKPKIHACRSHPADEDPCSSFITKELELIYKMKLRTGQHVFPIARITAIDSLLEGKSSPYQTEHWISTIPL